MRALTSLTLAVLALSWGAAGYARAEGASGLKLPDVVEDARYHGMGWGGRLGMSSSEFNLPSDTLHYADGTVGSGLKFDSLHVIGDYYFSSSSGFRASTGVIRGSLSAPWGTSPVGSGWGALNSQKYNLWEPLGSKEFQDAQRQTLPYVGAGYSMDLLSTPRRGSLSLSADLGVAVVNGGAAGNPGPILRDPGSFDDMMRVLHLRPVVQLGLKYSF